MSLDTRLADALSAIKSANLLSGAMGPGEKARIPGLFAWRRTTMHRTNRLQARPIRPLSARFLPASIVEWLFPMHLAEALPCSQLTTLLQRLMPNPAIRGLENEFAPQRCAATPNTLMNARRPFDSLWASEFCAAVAPTKHRARFASKASYCLPQPERDEKRILREGWADLGRIGPAEEGKRFSQQDGAAQFM